MLHIPGYSVVASLYSGRKSHLFKAVSERHGNAVALKTTASRLPDASDLARLHKEYDYLSRLRVRGLPGAVELIETGASVVVAMEYFDMPSLATVLAQDRLAPQEVCRLFAQVASILARVHLQGVIHRDIAPANILYDRASGQVRLIDFDSAMDMPWHAATGTMPEIIEGTCAYMSPEQTGRTNRLLDHRTDLYALGATMYEALTGQRPFPVDDLSELVHCHLAVLPEPPLSLDPALPPVLSAIVMKCLAKDAADRYRSARGLAGDLERCATELESMGKVLSWVPGTGDVQDRFLLSDRLFGRDRELALLSGEYARVREGQGGFVLIAGYSGVGKTSLVRALTDRVVSDRGYAACGKYDQYNRTTPYSGLIQALSLLLRQVLAENEVRIRDWKVRIQEAVGMNGRVLCEVMPELELLIGVQPDVPVLSPMEARTRFNRVFHDFLRACGDPGHPLVIFLDDLQWIDAASLELLAMFATLGKGYPILCVGAYRSNEVGGAHPLATTLVQLRAGQARLTEIVLEPLPSASLREFVTVSLGLEDEDVAGLAHVVYRKTGGNPLFFRTMLTSLHEQGHIVRDASGRSWIWDMEAVAAVPYADNVVEALQAQIVTLPERSVDMLILAACVGNPFTLDALAHLADLSRRETAQLLQPVLSRGFVTATSHGFELYVQAPAERLRGMSFRFVHDRIQQAAYALLAEERRPGLHLRTGRMLMALPAAERGETHVFDVISHMARAVDLLTDPAERLAVADLALRAGRRARSSSAFADSASLLRLAVSLLPGDAWTAGPDWTCAAYLDLAEACYLSASYAEAEELYVMIEARVRRKDDLLRLRNIQAKQYHHQGRFAEALEVEYQGLSLLGHDLPRTDGALMELFAAEQRRIAAGLAAVPPDAVFAQADNTDPRFFLTLEILFDLFADAYLLGRGAVLAHAAALMTRLSLEGGNNAMASVSFINYASTLCAMGADYGTGIALGDLAVRLAEKYREPALQNYTYHVYALGVCHWRNPLSVSRHYWSEASKLALASGSPYAGYVFLQLAHVQLAMGRSLEATERQMRISREFLESSGLGAIVTLLRLIVVQPVRHLRGRTVSFQSLDQDGEDGFDAAAFLEQHREFAFFVGSLRYAQLRVACLSGPIPGLQFLQDSLAVIDASQQGQVILADCVFFQGLLLAAGLPDAPEAERAAWRAALDTAGTRLNFWADLCAINFRHKALLLQAETARLDGHTVQAMTLYDQAIERALRGKFLADAGLAAEKAALFWLGQDMPHLARLHMEQAVSWFGRWGAVAKVRQLTAAYPGLLSRAMYDPDADQDEMPASVSLTGARNFSERIDLAAVIKGSQAISRHIVQDALARELTALAVENAGATRGVLLLAQDDGFVIAAEVVAGAGVVAGQGGRPWQDTDGVPAAIVHYALRTGDAVVVDNAVDDVRFCRDDYVLARRPASVCCLPIRQHGVVRGLVYLENDQVPAVFRADRVEVLGMLAAQATISLENVRVYKELGDLNRTLEDKVRERTALLEEKNRELLRLSTTDQLTGVHNRRHLEEKLEAALELGRRYGQDVAIILFDIDHFKRVNDSFGHHTGDEVLIAVAATVGQSIRRTDTLGRWGGEEFLVIVPESDNARQLAEKLRTTLARTVHPVVGRVTVSMGVATFRKGESVPDLLRRADEALYRAKRSGRNRVESAE